MESRDRSRSKSNDVLRRTTDNTPRDKSIENNRRRLGGASNSDSKASLGIHTNNKIEPPIVVPKRTTATQPLLYVYISPYVDISKEQTSLGAGSMTIHGVTTKTVAIPRTEVTKGLVQRVAHGAETMAAFGGAMGPVEALFDTGASHDNYVSEAVAEMLLKAGNRSEPCLAKICSGLGENQQFCVDCKCILKFKLIFFNDLLEKYEEIVIRAKVANISEPIFIGAPTIREHALLLRCYRSF